MAVYYITSVTSITPAHNRAHVSQRARGGAAPLGVAGRGGQRARCRRQDDKCDSLLYSCQLKHPGA